MWEEIWGLVPRDILYERGRKWGIQTADGRRGGEQRRWGKGDGLFDTIGR